MKTLREKLEEKLEEEQRLEKEEQERHEEAYRRYRGRMKKINDTTTGVNPGAIFFGIGIL